MYYFYPVGTSSYPYLVISTGRIVTPGEGASGMSSCPVVSPGMTLNSGHVVALLDSFISFIFFVAMTSLRVLSVSFTSGVCFF